MSIRETLDPGPRLQPLSQSMFSNHLGYNGFVISKDDCVVFVTRKADVSIGKRTFGGSIGASAKALYALDSNERFTANGLRQSILYEI